MKVDQTGQEVIYNFRISLSRTELEAVLRHEQGAMVALADELQKARGLFPGPKPDSLSPVAKVMSRNLIEPDLLRGDR